MIEFELYALTKNNEVIKFGKRKVEKFSFDLLNEIIKDQRENLRCIGVRYPPNNSISFFKVNDFITEDDKDLIYKNADRVFTF